MGSTSPFFLLEKGLTYDTKMVHNDTMENKEETRLTVRFPPSVSEDLHAIAKEDDRSLNWEVVEAVKQYVARRRKKQRKPQPPKDTS